MICCEHCGSTREETLRACIEAMQRIQQQNPPTSQKWQRASDLMRRAVAELNGNEITPEMWDAGVTR